MNDKVIRISNLNAAYSTISRHRTMDTGPVLASLQNEIDALNKSVEGDVAMYRSNGNRWP
jgi:hypothetical protein